MASSTPYSYEHPRRARPLLLSSENRKPRAYDESDTRNAVLDDAITRLETNLNDKMNTLFNRVEKCSDLSVASSRAVAALSSQFEDLKSDTDKQLSAISVSVSEMRGSMSRLCSESQNLTMTALEECCNELVKQIKGNTENIARMGESINKAEAESKARSGQIGKEFEEIRSEFSTVGKQIDDNRALICGISEEMHLVAEEAVNVGLQDMNAKFTKDLETFDLDWREYRDNLDQRFHSFEKKVHQADKTWATRYDDLKALFDERIKSEIDVRVKETLIPTAVNKVRRDTEAELEEMRKLIQALPRPSEFPDSAVRNISHEIAQVQTTMSSFTTATVPSLYREVELKIAHGCHDAQQRCLQLLKEFAIELEFDIDRMIELIHSVFVQASLPMPPGTSTSWQRFREVMFDRENIGGIRVRRPILGDIGTQKSSSRLGSRSRNVGRF